MIYFLRHGESEANARGVFAGQRDNSPLTDKGREQAKEAAKNIKERKLVIDRIVCSPLERAQDTAKIIANLIYFKGRILTDSRLAEYDFGARTGTLKSHATSKELIAAKDAEDVLVFQKRVMAVVEEVRQLPANTLLISHSGVEKIIKATLEDHDLKEFYNLPTPRNAHIATLTA